MNQKKVSATQMSALLAFYMTGSSLIIGSATNVRQDIWLCLILAVLLSLPVLWMHAAILNLYPGRNYFDNIIKACGKIPGKIICLLIGLYAFHVGAYVVRLFSEFIHLENMQETPLIAIEASIMGVILYLMKNRLFVLGRIAKFLMPFLLISVVVTVVLAFKDMNLDNIKPVLRSPPLMLARDSVTIFSLSMGESVIYAPMFAELDPHAKSYPVLLKGVLIAFGILMAARLRNLLILGNSIDFFAFSSYAAVSVISLGDFFTRIEILIGMNLLLVGFFKTCVLLYTSCAAFSKVCGYKDYEPLAAPVSLLFLTIAVLNISNTEELFSWLDYFAAVSLPIQIILPLIVLIAGKIRKKFEKPKKSARPAVKAGREEEETSARAEPQES